MRGIGLIRLRIGIIEEPIEPPGSISYGVSQLAIKLEFQLLKECSDQFYALSDLLLIMSTFLIIQSIAINLPSQGGVGRWIDLRWGKNLKSYGLIEVCRRYKVNRLSNSTCRPKVIPKLAGFLDNISSLWTHGHEASSRLVDSGPHPGYFKY